LRPGFHPAFFISLAVELAVSSVVRIATGETMKISTFLVAAILSSVAALADDGPFTVEFEKLAPGIWAGIRPDGPRFPVMGNTTFVISEEGVVVFDGGGMPAMSEMVIEKIRSLTDKPVTHVITSHWHGDHNFGVFRFAEEFDNVQFIAHEFTRDVINSTRINYVDRERGFVESNREEFEKIVATGVDSDGNDVGHIDIDIYRRILADEELIDREFLRAKVTPPSVVFKHSYVIESGSRTIELLFLGHGNTAGDIIMALPKERIVATGDIVVLPSPYAFNVPPRAWAQTLRNVNDLGYEILVPGHGPVQRDTSYVDLLIEVAESIAQQRDEMLARGMGSEEVAAALDFSAYEERFTGGDEYVRTHYEEWFEQPFRAAAMKALTGEPMVAIEPPVRVPFDDERWDIEAVEYELVDHLGERALRIKGGAAVLSDLNVENAMVEFDIAITPDRGFAGLVFRLQDAGNYEHFYIRPHQSGNPDANQYTPVINGVSGWQLYHGAGYGEPVEYRYNDWIHVKIIYAGSRADVYIDSETPTLRIRDLKRGTAPGAIGVNSANFSAVHFANFEYTELADAYFLPPQAVGEELKRDSMISEWQVSDAFDGETLIGIAELGSRHTTDRTWTSLQAESTGITNLANVHGLADGLNTVFARVVISADTPTTKQLHFGYSDAAAVFVNGALVYKGDNTYMSRDYRYLGTIGLFDSVALPLEAGENEIWIAVTESFGGWGVMGRIEEL
jgi:glyoxylase-like metal-dependent hydrolase (beta-lactamase superfamily II)